jgi:putative toxin-antitoxin system antitoxin component (TIGR02293 family)
MNSAKSFLLQLEHDVKAGSSANRITWDILGASQFMPSAPVSMNDFVKATDKGIPKRAVMNLAEVMEVPMKDMAPLLNVSYKTLSRKKNNDVLDALTSSLSIELASTVARGLSLFESREKFNTWLQKKNRALDGFTPFQYLNTPTGIRTVNRILGRMEEGIYT